MRKITQDTTQSSLTSFRTVKDYIDHVDYISFKTYELSSIAESNAFILSQLPLTEQTAVKEIFEKERAITSEVVQRYTERHAAVTAPNKTPEQMQLMSAYNLYSETRGTSLLTLGLNKEFNRVSERAALQKDIAEVTAKHAYAPTEGRKVLDKYGFKNVYKM